MKLGYFFKEKRGSLSCSKEKELHKQNICTCKKICLTWLHWLSSGGLDACQGSVDSCGFLAVLLSAKISE